VQADVREVDVLEQAGQLAAQRSVRIEGEVLQLLADQRLHVLRTARPPPRAQLPRKTQIAIVHLSPFSWRVGQARPSGRRAARRALR
jgi:hypothetical protein